MSRAERAAAVAELRGEGLNGVQIAARLGLSRSYTYGLIHDPSGEGDRRRKASYGRPCIEGCGRRTSGHDGSAKAPLRCAECQIEKQHREAFWQPERMMQAVREWVEMFGRPPSSTNWNTCHPYHDPAKWAQGTWPHLSDVQRRFGSWANLIEQAGFDRPQPSGPPPGSLSEEEKARTLALFKEHGSKGTAEILGITAGGVNQRLKRMGVELRKGATTMGAYSAATAIDRDIAKAEDRLGAIETEVDELRVYLSALKAAREALASTNGARAAA